MSEAKKINRDLIFQLRRKIEEKDGVSNLEYRPSHRATGWKALDEATGGGLIQGALNEVQVEGIACGVLEALLPALVDQAQTPHGPRRFWAWVHGHRLPYPPALSQLGFDLDRWLIVQPKTEKEQLWATETILRSGLCEGLVSFLSHKNHSKNWDLLGRRLQLAARDGNSTALLFGDKRRSPNTSSAALRLVASPLIGQGRRRRLQIEILKCRGRAFAAPVLLEWSHDALDEPAVSRSQSGELNPRASRQQNATFRPLRVSGA